MIHLVRQILVLVPRFDSEFVMIFQQHSLVVAKKVAPNLKSTFSENKLLRKDHTSSFLVYGKAWKGMASSVFMNTRYQLALQVLMEELCVES